MSTNSEVGKLYDSSYSKISKVFSELWKFLSPKFSEPYCIRKHYRNVFSFRLKKSLDTRVAKDFLYLTEVHCSNLVNNTIDATWSCMPAGRLCPWTPGSISYAEILTQFLRKYQKCFWRLYVHYSQIGFDQSVGRSKN